MLRNLIAKFNKSMSARVASMRHKREVAIKVSFEPTGKTGRLDATRNLFIAGETADLSGSGIAFTVASIRVKENYLVGEGRVLNAELDLPNGKVSMQIVGQRYELIGEHLSTERYLIGASIVQMSDENRAAYEDFLRIGASVPRNTGELKFGIGNR
ncbi:MAG: hypothetical protein LH472_16155 [Pyrinomonadaceae bacterium]|nr:hypothetical protein [Pyrinomonadaceae bacterium]